MIKLPYLQPLEGQQNTIYQFTGLDRRERIPDGAARDMQNLSAEGLPCLSVRGTRGKVEGQQNTIYQFTGLDRRERIPDGAARDMQNLSAEGLPCLSVRGTRGKVKDLLEPALLTFKNGKEILIDQNKLLVDGVEKYTVQTGRKIWAVIGSRVCIFPDKILYNAETILYNAETDKVEPLSAKQTAKTATFTNSTLTLDADAVFQKGDGVTITGCTGQPYNNRTVVIQEVSGKKITVYDNVFQHGELGSQQPESWQETNITLERVVPDLDFVCEKDNRLWGTHDNAICCCKLGDPKNWNVFNGLSTDAWETQVGSDGAFTGIAAFSSHIIALKEHICHKVYGTKPTAMQVQVAHIDGVKAGCDRSRTIPPPLPLQAIRDSCTGSPKMRYGRTVDRRKRLCRGV